ncbi:hypothetical protein KZ810_07045 [Sphingomonas sp. RHCKR47]|uniref:hypothetical protein n=1 Tax=Sphingomonas citricola TaxID=2862498 RepID=UPI001CA53113|nr:hypothetical protein [Sphingomonas citricola]MBW6523253.1 hypothetical protein [Sphingomonas citricola]
MAVAVGAGVARGMGATCRLGVTRGLDAVRGAGVARGVGATRGVSLARGAGAGTGSLVGAGVGVPDGSEKVIGGSDSVGVAAGAELCAKAVGAAVRSSRASGKRAREARQRRDTIMRPR